mmetsp:Transcript_43204/g.131551  ORF Transcript_43204/g.131551 Transcript_43204/m.131551 type:complete len:192 (-) Transcript_43204:41-616(-)
MVNYSTKRKLGEKITRDASTSQDEDITEVPLHLIDISHGKYLVSAGAVLTSVQLTRAFDPHAGSSIISDEETLDCVNAVTPLDFRVDWSKKTVDNLKKCFESDAGFSLVTESLKDNAESTSDACMELKMESVCSCDDMADIDDCEQLRDLWDESSEAARDQLIMINDSTGVDVVDTTWIEPEYPEVWRTHP